MKYAELVKEAIRKAHEEAVNTSAENHIAQFEVGKTYWTTSVCDHTCVFSVTILKRTAKTVVVRKGDGGRILYVSGDRCGPGSVNMIHSRGIVPGRKGKEK